MTDQGDEVTFAFHLQSQDAKAILFVVKRDPLHQTVQAVKFARPDVWLLHYLMF